MKNIHIVMDQISCGLIKSLWIYILITALCSCNRDDAAQQDQMFGRWEIVKAERNGKETNYLRRGYFIIDPAGTMTINITGADEKGSYKKMNHKLVMSDKTFEILSLTAENMVLKYVTSPSVQFTFYMQKKPANVQ